MYLNIEMPKIQCISHGDGNFYLQQKEVIIPSLTSKNRSGSGVSETPSFVRNVMGSSAGAGSGEFHVYRHLRRKEYARQKQIQQQSVKVLVMPTNAFVCFWEEFYFQQILFHYLRNKRNVISAAKSNRIDC